jgi:hypothetical protein
MGAKRGIASQKGRNRASLRCSSPEGVRRSVAHDDAKRVWHAFCSFNWLARKEAEMRQNRVAEVNTKLVKVGLEVFPVYGDERSGWSMDPIDLTPETPKAVRYASLDELFFALVNLNFSPEGQA